MKQAFEVLLGFVPGQYRKWIPLIFAVVLIVVFLFPQIFGSSADEVKSIALTQISPTSTVVP